MASPGIVRVTMFKVPDEENRRKLLGLYKTVAETAVKVCFHFPSPEPTPLADSSRHSC